MDGVSLARLRPNITAMHGKGSGPTPRHVEPKLFMLPNKVLTRLSCG
jgi:hypothetical protein